MAARVQLREITSDEGNRLLRVVRRTSGSVVTWRRAQIVLLSAQGMSPPAISKSRTEFLEFCRYIRSLHPAETRPRFVLENFSPHHGKQIREWALENNVELAYTPHHASWLNGIEAQFRALRYSTLAGTNHPDHATQGRLIRRYIHWRNRKHQ